jgi:hypothetical protein
MNKKKAPIRNLYQIAFHPEPNKEFEIALIAADSFEICEDQVRFYYNDDCDLDEYTEQELIAVYREWKFVRFVGKADDETKAILKEAISMMKDKT